MKKNKTKKFDAIILSSEKEKNKLSNMSQMLKKNNIPEDEILSNLGLFLTSKNFGRMLFFYEIYKKILNTHGSILEFGVRWGQTLNLMVSLRGLLEPFNRHRNIYGFDTFSGFKGISKKDGKLHQNKEGSFGVTDNYFDFLNLLLNQNESLNPLSHIKKFELIKGDAIKTIPKFFNKNKHLIVSLAILDFDIYKPTKEALIHLKKRMPKGSIIVFDELSDEYFPGETIALDEVFGISNCEIKRLPFASRVSYLVV